MWSIFLVASLDTQRGKYLSNNTGTTHYDLLQGSYWAHQKDIYNEKREILSCLSDAKLNKNDVQIESSHKNGNSEGETAHFNSNDPEPMEAHETKYTAHAGYGEVIYLITIDVYRS